MEYYNWKSFPVSNSIPRKMLTSKNPVRLWVGVGSRQCSSMWDTFSYQDLLSIWVFQFFWTNRRETTSKYFQLIKTQLSRKGCSMDMHISCTYFFEIGFALCVICAFELALRYQHQKFLAVGDKLHCLLNFQMPFWREKNGGHNTISTEVLD